MVTSLAINYHSLIIQVLTHPTWMDNIVLGYNNTPVSVPIFESIEFIDENTYRWTMYENVLNDLKPLMNLDFKRKN